MPLALFGITNDALNLVVNLLILFLVVVWLALVAWTYFDARRRLEDPTLVASGTAASLIFPYVGTVVYSILRPPEFIEDKRERELEIRAAELRVRQLEEQSCPNCEHPVEPGFLRCPNCRARIKDPCESCAKPIDPRWSVCPYCETPLRRAAPQARRASAASRARAAAPAPPQATPARQAREQRERERRASRASQGGRAGGPPTDGAPDGENASQSAKRSERSPKSRDGTAKKRTGGRRQGTRGRPAS